MILEYTKEVADQTFAGYNKEKLVELKLPMVYSPFSSQELVLNSQYFYQELIMMDKEEAE